MARTTIDIDEGACSEVMRRYHLRTKRDAVNLALRRLADEPLSLEDALAMEGTGWDGNLDETRQRRLAAAAQRVFTAHAEALDRLG